MIKAERKPVSEIMKMLSATGDCNNVVVAGCGTCVTICFAGGEQEVESLVQEVKIADSTCGRDPRTYTETTPQRQCEVEFIEPLEDAVTGADAVISLACGVGVQVLAERYPDTQVIPGLNTTFMGPPVKQGEWYENCAGCGDCVLGWTAGVCPVARCAKSMMNGPCGGSQDGKCEVGKDIDCGWALIVSGLSRKGQLDFIAKAAKAKDWSPSSHGGQRKMTREDLMI